MNTITEEAKVIATDLYFDAKKNIKAIQKENECMTDLVKWLSKVIDDVQSKYRLINQLNIEFNRAYKSRDMDTVKRILKEYNEIKEFMNVYSDNTIADLWSKEKTETKFDVKEFFTI